MKEMADKSKVAGAVVLLLTGIGLFYYWSDSLMIIRVVAVLAGTAAAIVVFWTSTSGKVFFRFAGESVEETKRVVWPTRKETLQTTAVVFAFVAVMAGVLWLIDMLISRALSLLMGWGQS